MRSAVPLRRVFALGLVVMAVVGPLAAFGPVVRTRVAAEAARRRLDVRVGSVGIGWFSLRLGNVELAAKGVSELRVHLDDVRVVLDLRFHIARLELQGGVLSLNGSPSAIRDAWKAWRAPGPPSDNPVGSPTPTLKLSAISLDWQDGQGPEPVAELVGIAGTHDERGTRLIVRRGRVRLGAGAVAFVDTALCVKPGGALARAHATSVVAEWNGVPPTSLVAVDPPNDPLVTPSHLAPAMPSAPSSTAAAGSILPLLIALPDLRAVRSKTSALARLLAEKIGDGAEVGADAMVWKIAQGGGAVPLTIGPGPFSVARARGYLEIRYATDSQAPGTPLALLGHLPIDASDGELTMEGGPVALPTLGVQEGAAGLTDVARASVVGRVRVVLTADGSALTFEGEGAVRGLSLKQASLANEVVRGFDLTLRARGVLTENDFRLDEFGANLGALHIVGNGKITESHGHVVAAGHFELPTATCESILASFPEALLPSLQGTTMTGTLAARGDFTLDTQALGDLRLDYDVQDGCRVVRVPPLLARERFEQPFVHRIYLPDGSTADETTGPGTPNWTPLEEISPFMEIAVLTTEDGAFRYHHGFNHAAIRAAIVANIKAGRFVRGASTITMQLAKNLFLSRDKTLSRKLEEVFLTDYLEATFSKDELMELYLNVIEFGPGVYGITAAAEYFFGRTPAELNLAECLFLSSILPAPLRYSGMRDKGEPSEGWLGSLHRMMRIAHKTGRITDAELAEAESEPVVFWHGRQRPAARAPIRERLPVGGDDTDAPPAFEPDAP